MSRPESFLYRQLADAIAAQIRAGLLTPGERLPSVRALCAAHQVSHSTAVQTCLLLEQEGWVEARPRRGYFVRPRPRGAASAPAMSRPAMVAQEIAVARVYHRRSEQMRHRVLESFPPGTRVTEPQGGIMLWVELPARVHGVALHDEALKAGLSVTPGVIFSPRGDYAHHVRLSFGMTEGALMQAAVARLGAIAGRLAQG